MEADPGTDESPLLRALPGWLCLLGGLALIALAVLTPAWVSSRSLAQQHQVMAAKARRAEARVERREQFLAALDRGEPLLLERLAYLELRLRPADKRPLLMRGRASQPEPLLSPVMAKPREATAQLVPAGRFAHRPPPTRLAKQSAVPETRLTRLTTGHSRWWLLAAGVLCAVGGLLAGNGRAEAEDGQTDAEST